MMVMCATQTYWWLVIWNKIHFIKVHTLVLYILQFNAWEWNILNLQNTELGTPVLLGFAPTIWVPVIFKTYQVNHTFLDAYSPPTSQEEQNVKHRCNGYYMHYSSDITSALCHIYWTSLPSKVTNHKQQRLWTILYAVYPFS